MKPTYWIIAGLGLVIALMILFDKDPQPDYSLHEARIAQREQAFHSLSRDYQKLLLKIEADSVSHKIEIQTYKDRDKAKSREIARIKASKIVIQVRDSVPEIDSLIVAYDSLLESKDEQIELQSKYIENLQVDVGKVTENFVERLALQESTIQDQKSIIEDQRKTIRKERRQKRFAKFVAIGTTIGGFLLGSQL